MQAKNKNAVCPLQSFMSTITKRWLLLVLYQIGRQNKAHYNELLYALQPISPKALADVLKELHKARLIDRVAEKGKPRTFAYLLNDDGKELRRVIAPLLKWLSLHTHHRDCPMLSGIYAAT